MNVYRVVNVTTGLKKILSKQINSGKLPIREGKKEKNLKNLQALYVLVGFKPWPSGIEHSIRVR